jgi:hypothetical protein
MTKHHASVEEFSAFFLVSGRGRLSFLQDQFQGSPSQFFGGRQPEQVGRVESGHQRNAGVSGPCAAQLGDAGLPHQALNGGSARWLLFLFNAAASSRI